MDAKPSPPSPGGGQEREVERYGPLERRRLRKDDGRRLIAYARVEDGPGAGARPAAASEESHSRPRGADG
jgi:hypothetical protein